MANMGIGNRIKEVRGGLFQKDFAKKIGVSLGAVQHWENDDTYPNGIALKKIKEEFNVDINWLLTGVESIDGRSNISTADKHDMDTDLLEGVIEWLDQYLTNNNAKLASNKKARFIAFAYQYFNDTDKPFSHNEMERYLKLVA